MNTWMDISELPKHITGRQMFIARGTVSSASGYLYTSDPYCVWQVEMADNTVQFARWPHPYPPTQFCLLPKED